MNAFIQYPIWDLSEFGGGFWIIVVAVFHTYIAHFAVGGGLFLVLAEHFARKTENSQALDYVKSHTRFFMQVTMVAGGVSGVGIWVVISLISPMATSILVNRFLFAWAAEWTFFFGEIAALLVYHYYFDRLPPKRHLAVGWMYFGFGWMSLFIINGIITVMLTPGTWNLTQRFWDGFFNPSFFPSLFFRTAVAVLLAGLFGLFTAFRVKDADAREKMTRFCGRFLGAGFFGMAVGAWWYFQALPQDVRDMILVRSPELLPAARLFLYLSPLVALGGLFLCLKTARPKVRRILAAVVLVLGLVHYGAFEWVREGARRPYQIYGHLYSNGILVSDLAAVEKAGILASARWVSKQEKPDGAGEALFGLMCGHCHARNGMINDIIPLVKDIPARGIEAMLDGMGKINPYMPPFPGSLSEKKALARYLSALAKTPAEKKAQGFAPPQVRENPLDFDSEADAYVLLAASRVGMRFISDADALFSLMTPGSGFYAQLIRRGEVPEIVTQGVRISYAIEPGFETPSAKSDFWKMSPALTGKALEKDKGLTGNGMSGDMRPDAESGIFVTHQVPAVPYPTNGGEFQPYPLVTLVAADEATGEILAKTRVVLPVSTEMGCKNCHGGGWKVAGRAGITEKTGEHILRVHDRMNHTRLLQEAESGAPKPCQACHGDVFSDAPGDAARLNLSAAIHGFHANYMKDRGSAACWMCHPTDPEGATRSFRGIHSQIVPDCANCHGAMPDHALGLLKAEKAAGKARADVLMAALKPESVESPADIAPRSPWANQPDCLDCHVDFSPPDTDTRPLNTWTTGEAALFRSRTDEAGLRCAACHAAPHALYPVQGGFGLARHNFQPMQYQKEPYPVAANRNCAVCHTIEMEDEFHHPGSLADFRNTF